MKKILAIMAATMLVLSMAGCGNGGDAGSAVIQGGAVADADGNEIKGSTIDGAGQEVDMDKIEVRLSRLTKQKIKSPRVKFQTTMFQ